MSSRVGLAIGFVVFVATIALAGWLALPRAPQPLPSAALAPKYEPTPAPEVVPTPAPAPTPAPTPGPEAVALPAADGGAAPEPRPDEVRAPASAVTRPERREGERGVEYLIRVLQTSHDFRVRVPAALALGRVGTDAALSALVSTLFDPHPAVRSASAGALGRHGNQSALPALRSALGSERNASVSRNLQAAISRLGGSTTTPVPGVTPAPSGGRFYVAVGTPSAARTSVTPTQLAAIERAVRATVSELGGVRMAPSGETAASARAQLEGSSLVGYHLDVAVSAFKSDAKGNARAVVSIMVATLPGHELRAIVKGTTAVKNMSGGDRAATHALEGAARSAARQLAETFERAAR